MMSRMEKEVKIKALETLTETFDLVTCSALQKRLSMESGADGGQNESCRTIVLVEVRQSKTLYSILLNINLLFNFLSV